MGLSVVDWTGLAQDGYRWRALVNLRVPYDAGKLSRGRTTCGLSSGTQLHRVRQCIKNKLKLCNFLFLSVLVVVVPQALIFCPFVW
jgi:hypothetical protein